MIEFPTFRSTNPIPDAISTVVSVFLKIESKSGRDDRITDQTCSVEDRYDSCPHRCQGFISRPSKAFFILAGLDRVNWMGKKGTEMRVKIIKVERERRGKGRRGREREKMIEMREKEREEEESSVHASP